MYINSIEINTTQVYFLHIQSLMKIKELSAIWKRKSYGECVEYL